MYDGMKIQKEDYLLGKKVDKHLNEKTDNDSILPPQICPSNNTFSQVDMTKKILEDPLVNIKKREIECTQKILQNPMRTKKQNIKPEKHTIDDHQLDMILVSRLKSYEKAGLDLAKILSITKHKEKKEHKSKRKAKKSSSEDDEKSDSYEKSINKQNKRVQKFNHVEREDRKQNVKKSLEYKDHRRNDNKNKNERHRSVSSSDDIYPSKTNKSVNECKHQRIDKKKYKDSHSKLKCRTVIADQNDDYQSSKKNKNEHHISISKEKHEHQNDKNSKNKNNQFMEEDNNNKYTDNTRKYEKPKYKQQDTNSRGKGYNNNSKRYNSESPDWEPERKKQNNFESKNNITEHINKYKFKSNEHHKINNSDKEYESKVSNDSRNRHGLYKNVNRRSRSESPQKEKKYQKINEIKKDKHRRKFSNSSSSDDEKINKSKHISKHPCSPEFQLDSEKHEKNDHKGKKEFGLFVPKGYSVKKSSLSPSSEKIEKSTSNIVRPKSTPVKKKKLTDEDMERMRKEMMEDAKIRDKERLSNVKRYRKEDKKEEEKQKPYSKEFLIKQLSHAASQVSVERSIKSNVNKLQKNHSIAD